MREVLLSQTSATNTAGSQPSCGKLGQNLMASQNPPPKASSQPGSGAVAPATNLPSQSSAGLGRTNLKEQLYFKLVDVLPDVFEVLLLILGLGAAQKLLALWIGDDHTFLEINRG